MSLQLPPFLKSSDVSLDSYPHSSNMSLKLTLNPQMSSYYSSEIDEDSVRVVKIHHPEVVHLGDIRDITQQQVSIRIRALKK